MFQQNKNFTTLLSDITPEIEHRIRSLPELDNTLPHISYSALELNGVNCFFHRVVTTGGSVVPLHSHSFFEYIYCRQVPDMEYLIGTHRYRIRSGDLIYIPPGTPHRPILPSHTSVPFVRDEMWLQAAFADSFGRRISNDFLEKRQTPYLIRLGSALQAEISSLFQKGSEEAANRSFRWDNAVEGYATLLLVAVCRALLDERTQFLLQEENSLFDRIIAYIEENLDKKISLDSTADRFYVSKSTINRTFQKHMGTSFYRCLTQRRLIAAQQLIMEGIELEEVSTKTGFSDYATFYRAFRQAFGLSPRQFKKMQHSSAPADTPSAVL